MTIAEAVATMTKAMKVRVRPGTVDTLKCGRPGDELRGVVTTFMPTQAVLETAARTGANLVVCHEPLRYSHHDETDWLRGDPVANTKERFIRRHRLAIYRTHDTWHDRRPDGILEGQMVKLGWVPYQHPKGSRFLRLPRWSVRRIAEWAKRRLGAAGVRVVGDPDLVPRTVVYHSGFSGGRNLIADLRRPGVEALICGEDHEWESYEWVRDASQQGRRKALIVLGHSASEEAGMEHMARFLRPLLPVPVRFVPAGPSYQIIEPALKGRK